MLAFGLSPCLQNAVFPGDYGYVFFSQYLTNLMHKICFTISFISCLYMFRAHLLIIRRSKLHYTASGIITPIGVMIPEATPIGVMIPEAV